MSVISPREIRPSRTHTAIAAATILGVALLTWYITEHATPQGMIITGIILTGMAIATTLVVQRQRRILERLDKVDRQFAHVRMRYVAEEIDPRFNDD